MPECNRKYLNWKVNNNLSPGQELVFASCCFANKSHSRSGTGIRKGKAFPMNDNVLSLINLSPFFGLVTSKLTVKTRDVSACAESFPHS